MERCRRAPPDNNGSGLPIGSAATDRRRAGSIRRPAAGRRHPYWRRPRREQSPQPAGGNRSRWPTPGVHRVDCGRSPTALDSFIRHHHRTRASRHGRCGPSVLVAGWPSIGFFAGAKLKTIAATGGPVQVLCDAPTRVAEPGIRPARSSLREVSGARSTASPRRGVSQCRSPESTWRGGAIASLAGIPNGWSALLYLLNARRDQSGIYLGTLDAPETVRLLDTEFRAAFAPPGYLLFVHEGTLLAQPFDVTTRQVTGAGVAVTERVGFGPATGEASFSTSASGLAYSPASVRRSLN